jgi:Spy/CpxP family protein refolding chaperone
MRWWGVALLVLVGVGAVPVKARAQGPAERALPRYFDKLNLTDAQKKKVFAVMDEYDPKIAQLQDKVRKLRGKPYSINLIMAYIRQIKQLQAQRQAALEKILDGEQRARLKELRGD